MHLYRFPCQKDFSHHKFVWDSETSVEKSISQPNKPYKTHFLAYFTLQVTLIMLNTLRRVEDHETHVRLIYLTTVIKMVGSRKHARIAII